MKWGPIIEGPDEVGKTTLGLKLSDILGLGYYRRRVFRGVHAETLRALALEECILDRSWLTDMHYSAANNRMPTVGRTRIWLYGLIGAKRPLVKLTDYDKRDADDLTQRYREHHWSEPSFGRPSELCGWPARPDPPLEAEIVEYVRSYMDMVDRFGQWHHGSVPGIGVQQYAIFETPDKDLRAPFWEWLADICIACAIPPRRILVVDHGHIPQAIEAFGEGTHVLPMCEVPIRTVYSALARPQKLIEELRDATNCISADLIPKEELPHGILGEGDAVICE